MISVPGVRGHLFRFRTISSQARSHDSGLRGGSRLGFGGGFRFGRCFCFGGGIRVGFGLRLVGVDQIAVGIGIRFTVFIEVSGNIGGLRRQAAKRKPNVVSQRRKTRTENLLESVIIYSVHEDDISDHEMTRRRRPK